MARIKTAKSSRSALAAYARRVARRAHWKQLELPRQQLSILRGVIAQTRKSPESSQAVLLAGERRADKSRVAQVLGRELERPVYRVDLGAVVSKYIGETEKNLDRVFSESTRVESILLIDEADALFGKRTEVKDAHDRYANEALRYAFKRSQAYPGVVLFAASLKTNTDSAFIRRFRHIVRFPSK